MQQGVRHASSMMVLILPHGRPRRLILRIALALCLIGTCYTWVRLYPQVWERCAQHWLPGMLICSSHSLPFWRRYREENAPNLHLVPKSSIYPQTAHNHNPATTHTPDAPPRISYKLSATPLRGPRLSDPSHRLGASGAGTFLELRCPATLP